MAVSLSTTVSWHGVFPAATTQFKPDESIDFDATARHLDVMVKAGVHGMILLGSVGENTALGYDEKITFLREMKAALGGRVPLLSGVAEIATQGACRFARDCERVGLDGLQKASARLYSRVPRGTVPGGEARNIHVGGGRYLSFIGGGPHFHNPDDVWPDAVDIAALDRYAAAAVEITLQLARA